MDRLSVMGTMGRLEIEIRQDGISILTDDHKLTATPKSLSVKKLHEIFSLDFVWRKEQLEKLVSFAENIMRIWGKIRPARVNPMRLVGAEYAPENLIAVFKEDPSPNRMINEYFIIVTDAEVHPIRHFRDTGLPRFLLTEKEKQKLMDFFLKNKETMKLNDYWMHSLPGCCTPIGNHDGETVWYAPKDGLIIMEKSVCGVDPFDGIYKINYVIRETAYAKELHIV